ncbi:MAG: PDDEXK nuclease domain-containing protein [Candidatus Binatia bacterium]
MKRPVDYSSSTIAPLYTVLVRDIGGLLAVARRSSARAVNALMTATYWEIGRRIVQFEQLGEVRAGYGQELLKRLSSDLTARLGRGFSERNLEQMRLFYRGWPIPQTLSAKSGLQSSQTLSAESAVLPDSQPAAWKARLDAVASVFPLPWSHYVRLLSLSNRAARNFYEVEALRGGWSVRQLDRQISSQFYERTALSKNKAAMLMKGAKPLADDKVSPDDEIRDPYFLEFLGIKDEYSESDLEEALVHHLEHFLLELGDGFTFVGRQKRLRIGNEWYRVDLVFFHRRLRCLVIIDLKVGKFTHADAGQMHVYLNYAREHWTWPEENPPVGLILCAQKDDALAKYALEGLQNRVLAREYKLALPNEKTLERELEMTRKRLESRPK